MSARPAALAKGEPVVFDDDLPPHPLGILQRQLGRHPQGRLHAWRLSGEPESASYAELYQRSGRMLAGLRERGLGLGDHVVLLIDDVMRYVPALWACLRAGVVPTPLNSLATSAQRSRQDSDLQRAVSLLPGPHLLCDSAFRDLARGIAAQQGLPWALLESLDGEPSEQDDTPNHELLWIVPTTGSTGGVKLVKTLPGNLLARMYRAIQEPPAEPRRKFVNTFAYDSITGLRVALADAEVTVHIRPRDFVARPLVLLQAIQHFGADSAAITCSSAASILHAQAESGVRFDLGSWRRVRMGAERIDPLVAKRFAELISSMGADGDQLKWGYGSSETGLIAQGFGLAEITPDDQAEGVVPLGRCAGGTWIRIVDDEDELLNEGDVGHVQVHGPEKVFPGYQGDAEASRACMTGDGWYRTGDVGRLRDGVLTLTGRAKELFVQHGRKLALEDVDRIARALPALTDSAVISAVALVAAGAASESLALALVPPVNTEIDPEQLMSEVNARLAKRLGVQLEAVALLRLDQVPRSDTGKTLRAELARRMGAGEIPMFRASLPRVDREVVADDQGIQARIVALWGQVLGVGGAAREQGDFFALGGDSIKSAQLLAGVEEILGRPLDNQRFFDEPTLANLLKLVGTPLDSGNGDQREEAWPLPAKLRNDLVRYLGAWGGTVPEQAPLLRGWNLNGTRRPLFWVLQDNKEASRFADALGPDQPLYVLRSGHGVMQYNEDNIQRLALHYVQQILALGNEGPIFLGGGCQGGLIALAMAQHLQRRRVELPLLVLMEWGFDLTAYSGAVLLVYGRESLASNPDNRYRNPELGRARVMPNRAEVEVPGGHGGLYKEGSVEHLVRALFRHMDETLAARPLLMPGSAYRARIEVVDDVPQSLHRREPVSLTVHVSNASDRDWPAWEQSGFALSCTWTDRVGEYMVGRGGHVPLPELKAGESCEIQLNIRAPARRGGFDLTLDLQEEGGAWFRRFGSTPWQTRIWVGVRMPWES